MKQRIAALLFLLHQAWLGAAADSFDYVIVGGGTAGLAVASRLSENPSVRVAVIEPGADERSNPNVTNPSLWTNNFGAHTDWLYQTVPQPGLRNRPLDYHQGKALGGSSAINGMNYIRAAKHEIDAWETLGNKGWNFASLYPYYLRSENFTLPNDFLQAAGVTFDASLHGDSGHVRTGYDPTFTNSSYTFTVREAWANLGVPHNIDTAGGDVYGVATNPMTLDRSLNLRWDSARSYLHPAENRPNLEVIRGTGRRLIWADRGELKQRSACGGERATGVEYISHDGKSEVLLADKEVILSAGSLRSPLILEASGVGNPRLLDALGIDVKVDLPGVGENYQEQLETTLQFSGTVNLTGATVSQAFVSATDVLGDSAADIGVRTLSELSQWAEKIASAAGGPDFVNKTAVETLLRLQHQLLFRENGTLAEALSVVLEGGVLAQAYWAVFPFSRGSVHLASADVADIDKPVIDPRAFLIDFDLRAQTDTGKLGEKLWRTEPLASLDATRIQPGLDVLPEDATDAQWIDFTRTASNVNTHNLGTASMMSRELGGVVDPQLKVYETSNVRVVDMSIFPMQHSGHPTATLYAVAERAADIIKQSSLYSS